MGSVGGPPSALAPGPSLTVSSLQGEPGSDGDRGPKGDRVRPAPPTPHHAIRSFKGAHEGWPVRGCTVVTRGSGLPFSLQGVPGLKGDRGEPGQRGLDGNPVSLRHGPAPQTPPPAWPVPAPVSCSAVWPGVCTAWDCLGECRMGK